MKKQFFFAVLMTLCILCAAASADPVITDREATAWIAENNYLYLQNAEGRISQMPLEMADLLQMTKDELICQTKDGRTIAVKKTAQAAGPWIRARSFRRIPGLN